MRSEDVPTPVAGHEAASAAVTAAFSILPYPITKDEAIEAVGGWPVPCGDGKRVVLGRMLDLLPQDEFREPMEAVREMDRHWAELQRRLEME